jgi:hypothetical protein
MFRLGMRLTLQGGREALIRLVLTAVAVAIGVGLLLSVLADFHAYQVSSGRQCWECTQPAPAGGSAATKEVWNDSTDFYQGQTIERLDVAALGSRAPVPPGISRLPGPGQFYASPALAALLRTVPRDELGARFPGTQIGTIGPQALSGPDELAIFIGYQPAQLAALPNTMTVDRIATAEPQQVFSPYFKVAFIVGALAVLFPMLILIGTATRLAASRREERFAAMRLVGATPRQISVIASIEAFVSGLIGVVLGIGIFAAVRPALANASFLGTRYFADTVTPTAAGYVGMLVVVPVAAAVAALVSLRRVRISPLGVTRRATPPAPSVWRLVPLVAGIALFLFGLHVTNTKTIGAPTFPGLLVILIGLVVAGPWLTAAAARVFAALVKGASPLLAARRLADNPKAAFRSVTGLVLAVFLGTIVAALVPTLDSLSATPSARALNNVLLATFPAGPAVFIGPGPGPGAGPHAGHGGHGTGPKARRSQPPPAAAAAVLGIAPRAAAALLSQLRTFKGASVFPIYSNPQLADPRYQGMYFNIVSCSTFRQLSVLGHCAPGAKAVEANDQSLSSDNPRFSTQAFVNPSNPAVSADFSRLSLQAVLVKVNDAATLERVRTFLAVHAAQYPEQDPPAKTFGESVQIRTARAATAQRLFYIAVALTLLVAGCSLAVAIGGSMVERKRPFSLLRVSGTPVGALYRVVLLEGVLPLAAATVVAAGTAYALVVLAVGKIAPKGTPTPVLGHVYYLTLGTGLLVSLLVIVVTMPLLGRITGPAQARFE